MIPLFQQFTGINSVRIAVTGIQRLLSAAPPRVSVLVHASAVLHESIPRACVRSREVCWRAQIMFYAPVLFSSLGSGETTALVQTIITGASRQSCAKDAEGHHKLVFSNASYLGPQTFFIPAPC